MTGRSTTAAARWRAALDGWRIPPSILAQAVEDPWQFPAELFRRRAAPDALLRDSPSARAALAFLGEAGTVLDVGSGYGSASLALTPPARAITAVDQSATMLSEFERRATDLGAAASVVVGTWPDCAREVGVHDVVVCHHVLYNARELVPFVDALVGHARHGVVVEITARHPAVELAPLWEAFHGLARPDGPTFESVVDVLVEAGIEPTVARWSDLRPPMLSFAQEVRLARTRLCLPANREPEVARRLQERRSRPRELVTLSWRSTASR